MRLTLISQRFAATAVVLWSASASAQVATLPEDSIPPATWELLTTHSNLTGGLPSGESLSLRAAWALPQGHSLQAELLDERKFGERGGVAALAYTRVFSPDWYGTGTLVLGHGGPNWANDRVDLQLSSKWLEQRQLVLSGAAYYAEYDGGRSDAGTRLSAVWYLDLPAVLEAGVTLNRSQPGSVTSHMPYASATFGREGQQYLSLRATEGTEAYQALGAAAQLVNFHSRSAAATWRCWVGPKWGVMAQAEHYRNPSYQRRTVGVGLFAQW